MGLKVLQRGKWALVVGLWAAYILLSFLLMERGSYGGGDFQLYYRAARDYLPTQMPYPTVVVNVQDTLSYPPLLPQLLMPLTKALDIQWATRVWYGFSIAALLATLIALSQLLAPKKRFTFWLLAVLFMPTFEALRIGQVNILLLALFAWAWIAIKSEHPTLGGFLLALAAWIKIYPALILVYFLWKRDWRVTWGGMIGGVGLGLFQIAISGGGVFVELFRSLALLAGQSEPTLMWKNNSIFGFSAKLFQPSFRVVPLLTSETLFQLTRFGLTALVIGALLALTAKAKRQQDALDRDARFDLEYALATVTMLLVSPWVYPDTFSQVFAAWFILWRREDGLRYRLLILVAVLLIIANYLLIWQPSETFSALLLSLGFYALAILWIVNVSLLTRKTPLASPFVQPEPQV